MPKILVVDIETKPLEVYVWGLYDNDVGLNQIKEDWSILSWAAKWLDKEEIFYKDQRDASNYRDDKELLIPLWQLLDEADVIVTQNGKKFDEKKINARFIINKMPPPSSFRHVDTAQLARRRFGFTSNKLEYLSDKLCTKHKKLKHKQFPGMELWVECLKGNMDAWEEMRLYNIEDILTLEELYHVLSPWCKTVNMGTYEEGDMCTCGNTEFIKNGHRWEDLAKYQRYRCSRCQKEYRGKYNLLSSEKIANLKRSV